MPLAAVAAIGAVGSIAAGAIGASAAGNAASTQANAALQAAQLQHQDAQAALNFQQQQFGQTQAEIAPWLQTGAGAQANLANLMGIPVQGNYFVPGGAGGAGATQAAPSATMPAFNPSITGGAGFKPTGNQQFNAPLTTSQPGGTSGSLASLINPNLGAKGSLAQPWTEQFTAPTNVTEQNDPGFQFRLQQGQRALEASAAAKGNLLSGGTAKSLDRYAQDYASNEYGNVYNRAFNEYATRYNQFQTNQANLYNRLAGLAGTGQQAAGQLGYLGQNAAQNVGNIMLTSGQQVGNQINNAAAAQASGYVGSANAWGGALSNLGGLAMLYGLGRMNTGGGGATTLPGAFAGDFSICWIARAIYGENDPRWRIARQRILEWGDISSEGARFLAWYRKNGEEAAKNPEIIRAARPFFDRVIA